MTETALSRNHGAVKAGIPQPAGKSPVPRRRPSPRGGRVVI